MKYALDTHTLIYFFKGQGKVAENLLATAPSDVLVPAMVVYELETGIAKSSEPEKRQKQLAELLDVVTVLPFDRPTASHAARIRAHLEQQGTPIGPMDTLIAATAWPTTRPSSPTTWPSSNGSPVSHSPTGSPDPQAPPAIPTTSLYHPVIARSKATRRSPWLTPNASVPLNL